MFRLWGKIWKDNHLVRDMVACNNDYSMSRTAMVFQALDEICHEFDLSQPIWLDSNFRWSRNRLRFMHRAGRNRNESMTTFREIWSSPDDPAASNVFPMIKNQNKNQPNILSCISCLENTWISGWFLFFIAIYGWLLRMFLLFLSSAYFASQAV